MRWSDCDRADARHHRDAAYQRMKTRNSCDSLHAARRCWRSYCAFMPVPIYLVDVQDEKLKAEEAEKAAKEAAEKGEAAPAPKAAEQINDTHPLWLKNPRDVHRGRI